MPPCWLYLVYIVRVRIPGISFDCFTMRALSCQPGILQDLLLIMSDNHENNADLGAAVVHSKSFQIPVPKYLVWKECNFPEDMAGLHRRRSRFDLETEGITVYCFQSIDSPSVGGQVAGSFVAEKKF
ncbi:hypothetical protein D5086_015750 [Populus alba]|uniref:Uncharacterized protein n=1 Tax=Populus alba TaxID=43335 RepID=A0ACC4BU31_POPAL